MTQFELDVLAIASMMFGRCANGSWDDPEHQAELRWAFTAVRKGDHVVLPADVGALVSLSPYNFVSADRGMDACIGGFDVTIRVYDDNWYDIRPTGIIRRYKDEKNYSATDEWIIGTLKRLGIRPRDHRLHRIARELALAAKCGASTFVAASMDEAKAVAGMPRHLAWQAIPVGRLSHILGSYRHVDLGLIASICAALTPVNVRYCLGAIGEIIIQKLAIEATLTQSGPDFDGEDLVGRVP